MSFIAVGVGAAGIAANIAMQAAQSGQATGPTRSFDPGVDFRFGDTGVTGQERARQKAFQQQADEVTKRELARYGNISGQLDDRAKSLADFFAANSSSLPTSGSTAGTMPDPRSIVTEQDLATKLGRVADYNTQQNEGLSRLRSFGDVWNDIGVGLTGDRSDLSNISNFRAGTQALLPFELQSVYRAPSYGNESAAPDTTASDIISGTGRVATSAALSGWNPFGRTPVVNPNLSGFATGAGPIGPTGGSI